MFPRSTPTRCTSARWRRSCGARVRTGTDVSPTAPLGQFLELALPTHDIAASVQFYERLGFSQRLTGDAWPHPYGVLGDGRIHLGLHQPAAAAGERASYEAAARLEGLTPCFVQAE